MSTQKPSYLDEGDRILIAEAPPTSQYTAARGVTKLDPLLRAELSRFIQPAGPLAYTVFTDPLLNLNPFIRKPPPSPSKGSPCKRTQAVLSDEAPVSDWRALLERLSDRARRESKAPPPKLASDKFWSDYQNFKDLGPDQQTAAARLPILRASITLGKNDTICFNLERPRFDVSSRLYRQFGWPNFLRVAVTDPVAKKIRSSKPGQAKFKKDLREFLSKDICIAGRTFEFLYPKDGSIFFVDKDVWPDFFSFINEIIPIKPNVAMSTSKFVSRLALSLSKTTSSITFPRSAIRLEPDITSQALYVGYDFMDNVCRELQLDYLPSCLKGTVHSKRMRAEDVLFRLDQASLPGSSAYIHLTHNMVLKKTSGKYHQVNIDFTMPEHTATIIVDLKAIKIARDTWDGPGEILTDGYGLISKSAALQIVKQLGLQRVPAVFQARFGSSKGLWAVSPDPASNVCLLSAYHWLCFETNGQKETPWILVRESQKKYIEPKGVDLIFEVVRTSSPTSAEGGSIGKQTIQVLSDRGVVRCKCRSGSNLTATQTNDIFVGLMREHLNIKLDGFDNWEDVSKLRDAIKHSCGITETTSVETSYLESQKVYGALEDEDLHSQRSQSVASSVPSEVSQAYGGEPRADGEKLLSLLDHGFRMQDSIYTTQTWERCVKNIINKAREYAVPIVRSCNFFVMVDPLDCLKENEIYVKFSNPRTDPTTLENVSILTGDVLVTREPCLLPTDILRVKAVNRLELCAYEDVVIFPARGKQSLCSLLSGGDYDGDTIRVIWDSAVVSAFQNADLKFAKAPFEESDYFDIDTRTIGEMLKPARDNSEKSALIKGAFVDLLFVPRTYGLVSCCHTAFSYSHGLAHHDTIRLAHLFALALDAPKQGKALKATHLSKMLIAFNQGHGLPKWTEDAENKRDGWSDYNERRECLRPAELGPHVMDVLADLRSRVRQERLAEVEAKVKAVLRNKTTDPDLTRLWTTAMEDAHRKQDESLVADLERIRKHTEEFCKQIAGATSSYNVGRDAILSPSSRLGAADLSARLTFDVERIRSNYVSTLTTSDMSSPSLNRPVHSTLVRKLKASSAYVFRSAYSKEPFKLAFHDILLLKADAVHQRETFGNNLESQFACGHEAPRQVIKRYNYAGGNEPPAKRAKVQ